MFLFLLFLMVIGGDVDDHRGILEQVLAQVICCFYYKNRKNRFSGFFGFFRERVRFGVCIMIVMFFKWADVKKEVYKRPLAPVNMTRFVGASTQFWSISQETARHRKNLDAGGGGATFFQLKI